MTEASQTPTIVFPFPRVPYALDQLDIKFSRAVLVPVAGLSTSYMSQFVACDLLQTAKHADYFATVLIAEILSKAEGPLYAGIRGQGFAYGASLNCYLWSGQISFDLYRSSEPQKALTVFYNILKELLTTGGYEKFCSDVEIETAQSSIAYRWASNGATAGSTISTCLRSSLHGFQDLAEYSLFIRNLYTVTRADLERVINKYYALFLSADRVSVLVTLPDDATEPIRQSFAHDLTDPIVFTKLKLSDFNL